MIKFFPGEQWENISFPEGALRLNYAISNRGRVVSYKNEIEEGRELKTYALGGYPSFSIRPFGKDTTLYIHRLVAQYFLSREEGEDFVIHKDYNKQNNHVSNLAWKTKREMEEHQQKSPYVIQSRKKRRENTAKQGHKLSATDVIRIKKKIFDPNRKTRLKMIAKQFNISEMQLYRIKSGENWSHIKVKVGDQYV